MHAGCHCSISTAEFALAGIFALVSVGSAPELSHKKTEAQLSHRACGTYLRGLNALNAPNSNSPIRSVPAPRRAASDRSLDHRTSQLPRHDLVVTLVMGQVRDFAIRRQYSARSARQHKAWGVSPRIAVKKNY